MLGNGQKFFLGGGGSHFGNISHFRKMVAWVKLGFSIDCLILCSCYEYFGFSAMEKNDNVQNKTYCRY